VTDTTFRNEQGQNLELERSNRVTNKWKTNIQRQAIRPDVPIFESPNNMFQNSFGLAADELSQSFAGRKTAGFHNCGCHICLDHNTLAPGRRR
jgi:hypothetical protein